MRWLRIALYHPSFGARCHDLTVELLREVVLLFFEIGFFLELDFDPKHSPQRKVPARR